METKTVKGNCLCGAVTVHAEVGSHMDACHCGMCRKWGGGPLLAVESKGKTIWDGEEHIGVYDSSDWAQRGFCKRCGTHLFYRLKGAPFYALPVGLLDNAGDFRFTRQGFIDEKPGNYRFADETQNLTGEEIFALFQNEE